MAPGQLSGELAATGAVFVRYPWADTNGDGFVQAGEVNTSGQPLSRSNEYNPANPSNFLSPGTVDPNIENDRTFEFIAGVDHQIMNGLAVGASYIWRKYDNFNWQDRDRLDERRLRAGQLHADHLPGHRALRAGHLLPAERSRSRRRSSAPTSPIARATSTASS